MNRPARLKRHHAKGQLLKTYDATHIVRSLGVYVWRGKYLCLWVEDPLSAAKFPDDLPLQQSIPVALLHRPWRPKRAAATFDKAMRQWRPSYSFD